MPKQRPEDHIHTTQLDKAEPLYRGGGNYFPELGSDDDTPPIGSEDPELVGTACTNGPIGTGEWIWLEIFSDGSIRWRMRNEDQEIDTVDTEKVIKTNRSLSSKRASAARLLDELRRFESGS